MIIPGAKADGVTDDRAAVQAWLNVIAGRDSVGVEGSYLVGATLGLASGTTIDGAGLVLKKHPSFGAGPLIANAMMGFDTGVYTAGDIAVLGTTIDGAGMKSDGELISMVGVDNFSMRRSRVRNCSDGIALSNCRNPKIHDSEFTAWGGEGSRAGVMWLGPNVVGARITDNWLHDGGSGVMLHSRSSIASGNRFERIRDVAFYGYPQGALIAHNEISAVRFAAGPCGALELCGRDLTVEANRISDCDGAAVILCNVINGLVIANICKNVGQGSAEYPVLALTPMVWLLSYDKKALSFDGAMDANPYMARIIVDRNIFDNANGLCPRAISVDLAGGIPSTLNGPPMQDVDLGHNTMPGKWSQGDVVIGPGTGVSLTSSKSAASRKTIGVKA